MKRKNGVYSTGQVATICHVAARTVAHWCDTGLLPHYKIPGSKDRRVTRADLLRFLKKHGLPADALAVPARRVLLVGCEPRVCAWLRDVLPEAEGYAVCCAAGGFEAGLLAGGAAADVVVIDLAIGRAEALQMAAAVRSRPEYERSRLIALACEDDAEPDALVGCGFSEWLKKPFDPALLAERVAGGAKEG